MLMMSSCVKDIISLGGGGSGVEGCRAKGTGRGNCIHLNTQLETHTHTHAHTHTRETHTPQLLDGYPFQVLVLEDVQQHVGPVTAVAQLAEVREGLSGEPTIFSSLESS